MKCPLCKETVLHQSASIIKGVWYLYCTHCYHTFRLKDLGRENV